ncbi:MAG: translation initiation factor IF-3 [Patescibacteria group bacterium]
MSRTALTLRRVLRIIQRHFILNLRIIAKDLRINQQIRSSNVRLIGAEGEQLGVVTLQKALQLAEEAGLDLAEVAPNAEPPVCKILDYGKYQYHQRKVDSKHKRQQKKNELKGMRLGFKTGDHDLETKAKHARKFLEDGNSVKLTLIFKGREAMYKDLALAKMMKFYEAVQDLATMESNAKKQGNSLIMILTPKS